jgi:hypothetical protein
MKHNILFFWWIFCHLTINKKFWNCQYLDNRFQQASEISEDSDNFLLSSTDL